MTEVFRCSIDLSVILSEMKNQGGLIIENTMYSSSPPRRKRKTILNDGENIANIFLNHASQTGIENVGFQLWNGCFLLADYLLFARNTLREYAVVEFGGGVGLVANLLRYMLRPIGSVVTDYKMEVIDLTSQNVDNNSHLSLKWFLPLSVEQSPSLPRISCRILDWTSEFNPRKASQEAISSSGWTDEDISLLKANKVLFLAADVLYDDLLTVHFFKKLVEMILPGDILILTLEKRVNFSSKLLREIVNCYELFLFLINHESMTAVSAESIVDQIILLSDALSLKELFGDHSANALLETVRMIINKGLIGEMVPLDHVPQYVTSYERNKYMEIWQIICGK